MRLVTRGGKPVGWIVPPSRRRTLAIGWDGRIRGKRVPDGNYDVRLVYRSSVLATTPLRIDTHAPQLTNCTPTTASRRSRATPTCSRRSARTATDSATSANISFTLKEAATVTMDVTRTVKVPHGVLHVTAKFGRGRAHDDLGAGSNLNPRTYLVQAHRGRRHRQPHRLRRAERVRRALSARGRRAPSGDRRRLHEAELSPGRASRRSTSRPTSRRSRYASSSRAGEGGHVRGQPVRRRRGRRRRRRRSTGRAWRDSAAHDHASACRTCASGLYYVAVQRPPTAASATRRSSCARPSSGRRAACSSCCRRTPGRRTTSRT